MRSLISEKKTDIRGAIEKLFTENEKLYFILSLVVPVFKKLETIIISDVLHSTYCG